MAGPDKLILIRHGEKAEPASPQLGGVDDDGKADAHSLTVRGWQRAGALVGFFEHPTRPEIATPNAIFAAEATGRADDDDESKSRRPIQTVSALRDRLGSRARWVTLPVDKVDDLVAQIRGCDGVVLVCWEHKRIPLIAAPFVSNPPAWGDRFDLVWVLDRSSDGYRLVQCNQDLLAGDEPG